MGYYRDRYSEILEKMKKGRSVFQSPQEQMRAENMPMQQIRGLQWEAVEQKEEEPPKKPYGPEAPYGPPKPTPQEMALNRRQADMETYGKGLEDILGEEKMPEREARATSNWLEISPAARPFAGAYSKLIETPLNAIGALAMTGVKAGAKLVGAKGVEKTAREMKWDFEHPPITGTLQRDFEKNVQTMLQDNNMAGALVAQTIESVSDLLSLMTHMGILSAPSGYTPGMIASAPEAAEAMRTGKGATKYITKHMAKLGAYSFAARPGDIPTRIKNSTYMVGYNLTPWIANATGATGLTAQMIDTALNTFLTSPEYIKNIQESKNPVEFIYKSLPTFIMDVGMAWKTRGWPSNQRARYIKQFIEKQPMTSGIGPVEHMRIIAQITSKLPPVIKEGRRPLTQEEAARQWRESTPYEKTPKTGEPPLIERVYPRERPDTMTEKPLGRASQYYELEKTGTRSVEPSRGATSTEGQVNPQEAVKLITDAIKSTKPLRAGLEKAYTEERAKRFGEVEKTFKTTRGQEGFFAAKGKLSGQLAEKPIFEPVQRKLTQGVVDELYEIIKRDHRYDTMEKVNISEGLTRILRGELPQPNQYPMLQDVFGAEFVKSVIENRPTINKVRDIVSSVVNLPKAIKASFDFSAPFRQAIFWSLRPSKLKFTAPAFIHMFKTAFSEKEYKGWYEQIQQDPLFNAMRKHGLDITDVSAAKGLSGKEESFMTDLPEIVSHTPVLKYTPIGWAATGIRMSNQAFSGFLNKLRFDVARSMYVDAIKNGFNPKDIAHKRIFDSIGKFVNTTTGRGDIGKLAFYGQELNALFWSPRFIKSRLDLFNPVYYKRLDPTVRKELILGLGEMIGTGMTIMVMAKLAGADVELDPRSTDFGKIKVGRTRWDIWGGHQQYVRVVAQLISNQRKTSSGKMVKLGKKQFPFETRTDVLSRFGRGKLAPVPQVVLEIFEGQKLYGDEIVPLEEIKKAFIPMVMEDIIEAYGETGASAFLTVGVPAALGVGVQTYDERPTQPSGKSTEDLFERFHKKKRNW